MALTMMHFIQLHYRPFFLNDICCRPVRIAKRFSIANNCWQKTKKTKEQEVNKVGKISEMQNSTKQRKTKFQTFRNA